MNDKAPERPSAPASPDPPRPSPQPGRRPAENVPRGIACLLAATTLFSVVNMTAKWLSQTYPVGQIVFFRSALSVIPCAIIVAMHGGLLSLRTDRVAMHGVRTFFGFVSLTAAFLSFALMPLGDAVAIGYAGPLFVTALSVPLLGERVGVHRWSAVGVGFLGVLLMAHPSGNVTLVGVVAALANAFFYALSMISVRQLGATETATAMLFYHSMFSMLFAVPLLGFGWVTPGFVDLLMLASIGLIGGVSQYLVIHAFRQAPPSALSPFAYVGLIWALFWSWAVWGDLPTVWLLGGAALVAGSGLYILHREIKLGLIRRRASSDTP